MGQEIQNDMRIMPLKFNVDGVEGTSGKDRDIKHMIRMETIIGSKRVSRTFDLGGKIPDGDGPTYMLAFHDESCCNAGEYCDRAWAHKSAIALHRFVFGGMVSPVPVFLLGVSFDCTLDTILRQRQWQDN